MPKIKNLKQKRTFKTIFALVIMIAGLIAGTYYIRQRQLIGSSARTTEGECESNSQCVAQLGSGYICSGGYCVLKNPGPGGGGNDRSTGGNSELELPSCDNTGNCGVAVNSKTKGAFRCINKYDSKTYWCCPSGQGSIDGKCSDFNIPSCSDTGNCGVNIGPNTQGAAKCINQYDNKTYWCCPSGQVEINGSCRKKTWWWRLNI